MNSIKLVIKLEMLVPSMLYLNFSTRMNVKTKCNTTLKVIIYIGTFDFPNRFKNLRYRSMKPTMNSAGR